MTWATISRHHILAVNPSTGSLPLPEEGNQPAHDCNTLSLYQYLRGVSHQPAHPLSVGSTTATGASGDAVLLTERHLAKKPLVLSRGEASSPVEDALDLVHIIAETPIAIGAISLRRRAQERFRASPE